jgi:8-oxo-dGTP diphosphatase
MSACPVSINLICFGLRDDRLQVLLASKPPAWEFPGEAVAPGESLEQAAAHLLDSLIDSHDDYLDQLYTYGGPQRRGVCVVYFALVSAGVQLRPGHALAWFPVSSLPGLNGDHPEILAYAVRRLRYKLEYSAVGFHLLSEEFSLSELQRTYEAILGEKLDKRNFRRRLLQSGFIEITNRYRSGDGRPARLYRYRPDAVAEVRARRLFP